MLKHLPIIGFLIGIITSAAIAYAIVQYNNAEHIEKYHSSIQELPKTQLC